MVKRVLKFVFNVGMGIGSVVFGFMFHTYLGYVAVLLLAISYAVMVELKPETQKGDKKNE